jgi:DNA-binding NarL/FixJ family response regulator
VDVFADSLVALNEIEAAHRIEVLVTRVSFRSGMPNGVSLALVLRVKYPSLKVIFTAREEREVFTKGVGEFLPHPVDFAKLVEAVERLVQSNSDKLPPTGVIPSP